MIKKTSVIAMLFATFVCINLTSCNNSNSEKKETPKVEDTKKNTEVDYTGTYHIVDKTSCDISIVIKKSGNYLTYKSGNVEGKVEIIVEDKDTYLNFMAINGKSPEGDCEAKYENESLMIQNEGNSMNQYNHFKQCDAKYLELKKIK